MPVGVNDTRFSLRFVDKTLKVTDTKINDIKVAHIQNGNIILINNKLSDVTVEKVTLFNILIGILQIRGSVIIVFKIF